MKVATVAVAYNEARLIQKHLRHIPDWVSEKLVLVSEKPWNGLELVDDGTADLAREMGATVIQHDWATEEDQRNAGQEYLSDYDYIIVLDPDEFLDDMNWAILERVLWNEDKPIRAGVVDHQLTYWKNGYVANPSRDYPMLIVVKPDVRFVDKRVVDSAFSVLPVYLHHMSWAKTSDEVWRKISHYAHAQDFDIEKWFNEVWLKWEPGMQDVHPVSPETLHNLIDAQLPPELEELDLWP